ncbi:maleylpyruvate isomerase family mycothiol-dependent enzyme [Candidatus Mycobacterium wuenschmannii]|uniref:Maleylpyruvate isomerase family mycothiol-dependent enzyme n=1 Tax=Candidatus Mycobacterium wuenschmannii TaxID=3027808 RepID=A0ABY8W0Q5_9MYCO|nr:maleylpyruvate isomerase family mycothiol-dependent enzyme [Candidatus Mycobacterium wuenschmannii]WIM87998.1 maleylpyruvate isomerase family mycothiol-dependent enzyme [Candidatus Mycobacterium wuenschmannii]
MGSVTILDKADVLSGLFGVWDSIEQLLDDLTEEQWQTSTPLPGWCVHDVVAHMIGTESSLQGIPAPDAEIDLTTLDHVRNDVGAANEQWVRHLGSEPGDALLQRFRAITADRCETLSGMSVDEWNAPTPSPVGLESFGRFMRVRLFDCWMHEQDIRDGIGSRSPDAELGGPAARQSLDEIAATMGYVVGKLGKAPDGSRVAIELTGPLARTIRVAVDGRAQVVDDFGGLEPTVSIRLDGLLLARLAGGRTDDTSGVALGGDTEVGARIVERLNFVI